jgi:hypothetical protein
MMHKLDISAIEMVQVRMQIAFDLKRLHDVYDVQTQFVKVVILEVNSTLEMGSENSMESDWLKSEA